MNRSPVFIIAMVLCAACQPEDQRNSTQSDFKSRIIFPLQDEHVHGSTVVELPDGDLLAAWFQGSGERWADDVRIVGSRLSKGDSVWSETFLMADMDGFPDINPILFMDQQEKLWLMWYPVLANQWETSLPMFRISEKYTEPGPPEWTWQDILLVKAGDKTERGIQPGDTFVRQVTTQLDEYETYLMADLIKSMPDSLRVPVKSEWRKYRRKLDSLSKGENMVRSGRIKVGEKEQSAPLGYPLTRRLGWQTKNKAVFIGRRMIVPLYSDGFDCTLFALTDDGGKHWTFSNPVLGGAGIQATIGIRKDSSLVAYLRDNGPPPKRMQRTESHDKGLSWSIAKDDTLSNPGAGFDMVTLANGEWLMVFNDQEEGRFNLTAAISDDEGKSWKWRRSIEDDGNSDKPTASHYPSVIEGAGGQIHVVYSYHRNDTTPGKTIKYVSFPLQWVKHEPQR